MSFKLAIVSLYCCCCSFVKSCPILCNPQTVAHQTSLSFSISLSSLKLISIESVMPSNHFTLCHSLLLLPSIFPSIRVFSKELTLHIRWAKNCSFSLSISPFSEYSKLISFRIDQFDLLAVQRTLRSLLQHHNLKVSILWHSAFFMVQLSHLYMTTGKPRALTIENKEDESHSVVSDSLRPHGLQHTRLPCPSPTHLGRVYQTLIH